MEIASRIEHTFLKADTSLGDIKRVCAEAIEHKLRAVCIPPFFVKDAARYLEGQPVKLVTVVGYPMGYAMIPAKVEEVKRALEEGADEVDVVANIAAIKSERWAHVRNDIDSVTRATHLKGRIIKIIVEAALLTDEELQKLCGICVEMEVDYIKTSTGMNAPGADVAMIEKICRFSEGKAKVKAAGGIRDFAKTKALIEAGADVIGTSTALEILAK